MSKGSMLIAAYLSLFERPQTDRWCRWHNTHLPSHLLFVQRPLNDHDEGRSRSPRDGSQLDIVDEVGHLCLPDG